MATIGTIETILGIVVAVLGLFASIGARLILPRIEMRIARRPQQAETVAERIAQLTESLSDAATLVTQIEREIEERSALVSKLEQDVETYNQVAALKKAEVEAVAQVLRGELKTEGRRSFWLGVGVNFFFFVLGVAVTVASTFVTGHIH